MTAAAAPDRPAPRTHLERGRCIACDKPYSVKVRTGYYVKCPSCSAVNPGSAMRDQLNKAAVRERPSAPPAAPKGKGSRSAPTTGVPSAKTPASPPRPRKPTVSGATQPPLKPAAEPQQTSQHQPPAKGRPGFFSRLMGIPDEDEL